MTRLPDRYTGGKPPERRLTPEQFEQVIRRAAELQATGADEPGGEGIPEAEIIRIGREIGLAPEHVRRALAETATPAGAPPALSERLFGPYLVSASRTVPGDAEAVRAHIDEYLTRRERLAAIRRFPERTVYERGSGIDLAGVITIATEALASRQPAVGAGFKLRRARRVEIVVQPLEDGFSHVTLIADLGNLRTGNAAAGTGAGAVSGFSVAVVLGIAVDPAAALLGAPLLGGGIWGGKLAQARLAARVHTHLEALLDSLERGEPLVRPREGRR